MTAISMIRIAGFKPLYWIGKRLIVSRGYTLYWTDEALSAPRVFARLPVPSSWRIKSFSRISERIFRGGIQTAERIDPDHILVTTRTILWRVNLISGEVAMDFMIPDNRRLLFLTALDVDADGTVQLAFGEYFDNPSKVPVRIWTRDRGVRGIWSCSFTFSSGEINHVHNICRGTNSTEWYVLTGDFGGGAGIWRTDASFSFMTPVVRGSQAHRATWLRTHWDGSMTFATDTQLQFNSLRTLTLAQDAATTEELAPTAGSSIYYQFANDGIYFSTAVEPGKPTGSFIRDLFSSEIGEGIRGSDAVIYHFGPTVGMSEIFRARKDIIPLRLGQFGSFMFPSGTCPAGYLAVYAVALRGYDDQCLLFSTPT